MKDFFFLKASLKEAKRNQLEKEFAELYRNARAHGDSVYEACWCALYEWDMGCPCVDPDGNVYFDIPGEDCG